MPPTVFGKEVWPCDICGHLKYAETGKHLSNYEITIWCAKVNKNEPPLPSEVGYCSNLWMNKLKGNK